MLIIFILCDMEIMFYYYIMFTIKKIFTLASFKNYKRYIFITTFGGTLLANYKEILNHFSSP